MALMKAASRLRSVGKSPLALAYDERFGNYSALASPSNLRHVRFVLQIVKLTWMRPIAKGRSRPFQRRLDQTISTVSRGELDLRSVRNAYIT
jgi:hypothetical protein